MTLKVNKAVDSLLFSPAVSYKWLVFQTAKPYLATQFNEDEP